MVTETRAELVGVGAFIVDPHNLQKGFITVEEMVTKERSNKFKGMRSYPMETIEEGENHNQALGRLFKEEVCLTPALTFNPVKLGQYELVSGVVLHTYLFEAPTEVTALVGSASSEVKDPRWTTFAEVLYAPLGAFRGGVYETVVNYLKYVDDPSKFQARTYTHVRDRIPWEAFRLIREGINEKEALSRLVGRRRFSLGRRGVIHLR